MEHGAKLYDFLAKIDLDTGYISSDAGPDTLIHSITKKKMVFVQVGAGGAALVGRYLELRIR